MKPSSKNQTMLIPFEDEKKQVLFKTIAKKRKELSSITAKVEMLKMDLDIIKREYDVRIGKLYLKDDQLDLEILRYKRLKSLLEEGLSFEKALKEIDALYKNDQEIYEMKYEEILQEETTLAKRKQVSAKTQKDIKKLWKKLLFQLHPDLTLDEKEKRERELIMKRINDAYAENDFEMLKQIETNHYVENLETTSIENLEKKIEEIENSIISFELEYRNLKTSEWAMWKRKTDYAKSKNIDLFKELEEKLLNQVARKIMIVHAYREEFDKLESLVD